MARRRHPMASEESSLLQPLRLDGRTLAVDGGLLAQ
jgi:hypothetical protein